MSHSREKWAPESAPSLRQPGCSVFPARHLKLLLDAGVLGARREGYYVLYEVQRERLVDLAYDVQHLG